MRGTDFIKSIPESPGEEREQLILQAVQNGDFGPIQWVPITSEHNGYKITIFVSADVLRVGDIEDSVRVATSHVTAQKIVDILGSVLPTAKISDLIHSQADKRIGPCFQSEYDERMMRTSRMLKHHNDVERLVAGFSGLVAPLGKDWANTVKLIGRLDRSANYGLHDSNAIYRAVTPIGGMVWQPGPGTKHIASYTDYSQMIRLICRTVLLLAPGDINVTEKDIEDITRDESLCWLVSSEGVLKNLRHPAVPRPLDQGKQVEEHVSVIKSKPMPLFTRTLRLGSIGDDVKAWQRIIGTGGDGIYGKHTREATRMWQSSHGVTPDGVVGPRTRRAYFDEGIQVDTSDLGNVAAVEPAVLDDDIEFVACKNFNWANRKQVKWIVIHSAEMTERPNSAEALASWLAGPDAPRASWHFAVDCDSVTQSVKEEHIAWHAPGSNELGIGIEQAGYHTQTREQWLDDYGEGMLHLLAKVTARSCKQWDIPIEFVDAQGLRDGKPGITTHKMVTDAWHRTTHIDPGKNFPMDYLLELTREEYDRL